ncbi:DUF5779 family protein [Halapricum desulfuricans]|uniref:Uncharacterized protein n=1 Tax=Halapricum desulfuricans TaxID=2841257 RepID=A0A897N179_9EURY|nr:DUF5779 family protein [Halapricum desulfuricans]QSG06702.1 Uncharacterized protein HSR121_2381 [Halapricum desulfuricans]
MAEFDLDLQAVEDKLEGGEETDSRIVLDILDGSTPDAEWVELIEDDAVLVLSVEGDVNERAAGFAREVRDMGGELVHFRGFLIVTPPGVSVETDRLN